MDETNYNPPAPRYLMEFLVMLFKNKKTSLFTFTLVTLLAIASALLMDPVFEARSTVLVKMGMEFLAQPELSEKINPMPIDQERIISSELQILSSKELLDKVIKEIKVERIYPDLVAAAPGEIPPHELAVLRFEDKLKVAKVKNSAVIGVSFQHKDPQIAAQAVNILVERFRDKHLQVYREPQSNFLQQQLENYTNKLNASQDALEKFKAETNIFVPQEQRSLLLTQRSSLDALLKASENGINELVKKVSTLESQAKLVAKSGNSYNLPQTDTQIDGAKTKLLALMLEEQNLLKSYKPSSTLVVNVRNNIRVTKEFISEQEKQAEAKSRTGNEVYLAIFRQLQTSKADLDALKAKTANIREQLREINQSIRVINLNEQKLEDLKREKLINEKNYETYVNRAEESRLLDEMNKQKLSNIRVIQSASVPAEPVSMSKAQVIILGVVGGMILAVVSAFLSDKTRQTFSTPRQIEKALMLPVLASLQRRDEK